MESQRVLTMNIGNSNISIGAFEGRRLVRDWRLSTDGDRTSDELGLLLKMLLQDGGFSTTDFDGVVIASVVPPLSNTVLETCEKYLHLTPLMVGPGMKTGLPMRCDNPRDVGADRVANAVAAVDIYGAPVIVVKLGTATTLCVVDGDGAYIGGIIAPGLKTSVDALAERTAKLPRIELTYPTQVIGKNTIASMKSGAIYGAVGMVDGLVDRIRSEVPLDFQVVATGGLARFVSGQAKTIQHIVPHLTLEGLRLLWTRNHD